MIRVAFEGSLITLMHGVQSHCWKMIIHVWPEATPSVIALWEWNENSCILNNEFSQVTPRSDGRNVFRRYEIDNFRHMSSWTLWVKSQFIREILFLFTRQQANLPSAKERTQQQHEYLFAQSGLTFKDLDGTDTISSTIEAVANESCWTINILHCSFSENTDQSALFMHQNGSSRRQSKSSIWTFASHHGAIVTDVVPVTWPFVSLFFFRSLWPMF